MECEIPMTSPAQDSTVSCEDRSTCKCVILNHESGRQCFKKGPGKISVLGKPTWSSYSSFYLLLDDAMFTVSLPFPAFTCLTLKGHFCAFAPRLSFSKQAPRPPHSTFFPFHILVTLLGYHHRLNDLSWTLWVTTACAVSCVSIIVGPSDLLLMSTTESRQTSTFQRVDTALLPEHPTVTGRGHSACPDCRHHNHPRLFVADKSSDGHSPNSDSANNTQDHVSGPSSSQAPASSANNSSSSHSHRQHSDHNMSTLIRSGTGTSFARNNTSVQRSERLPHHAALIPRSALTEAYGSSREADHASPALETHGYRSLNIDIPLDTQPTVSVEVARDGKTTGLTAELLPYGGSVCSDTCQGSYTEINRTSSRVHRGSISNIDIVHGSSSSRKPIPAHWLPAGTAPNLATAQRAKERGHKRGSVSGSPGEVKSIRGTRSLADIGRAQGAEGQSFLTKNALAAVECDLTSSTAGRSPTKYQRSSSKPAWNSPATSPLRESSRHHAAFVIKGSPTKNFHNAETRTHKRGISLATSAADSIYYSAESSPVRDDANSTPSFDTPVETFDEYPFPIIDFLPSADNEDEQALQHSRHVLTPTKAATIGRSSSIKPRLKVEIPALDPRSDDGDGSTASRASGTSSSGAGSSLCCPTPASPLSRIPRVAATNATLSTTSPTLGSASKRSQISSTLTPERAEAQQTKAQSAYDLSSSGTMSNASVRHVRIVDNLGATPILSRHAASVVAPSLSPEPSSMEDNVAMTQGMRTTVKSIFSSPGTAGLEAQREIVVDEMDRRTIHGSSRASSLSTVKAVSAAGSDPAMIDSAIIYSKKSGTSGTTVGCPFRAPSIIVIMAHNFDLGTFGERSTSLGTPSKPSFHAERITREPSPVRGRTEQFVPTVHRQVASERSLQSSLGSDLRATAVEFVPGAPTSAPSRVTYPSPTSPIDPTVDRLGAAAFELDMHGIPWFYYMYQVQSAYNQGFQNGRSRSPKKFRTRKQQSPMSSPTDVQPITYPLSERERHHTSTMPPPSSTLPLAQQRAQQSRDTAAKNATVAASTEKPYTHNPPRAYSPFAAQKAIIAQQAPLRIDTNVAHVDITSIRNVPLRNRNAAQFTGARRFYARGDNGLYSYGGRGVPMQETVPFPTPVAPMGRPVGMGSAVGSEACGTVEMLVAAERGAGGGCFECEPDH
jgi:hypothetical protein